MADSASPSSGDAPRVNLDKRAAGAPPSLTPPPPAPVDHPVSQPPTSRRVPGRVLLLGVATIGLLVIAFAGWHLIGADQPSTERMTTEQGTSTPSTASGTGSNSDSTVSSVPSSVGAFDAFAGTWSGVVSQFDDAPQVDFPMTLTLAPSDGALTGETTYDLSSKTCIGDLEFVSGDATVVRLREHIVSGQCIPSGRISVQYLTDDSVSFEYRSTKRNGAAQVVRGVLTR